MCLTVSNAAEVRKRGAFILPACPERSYEPAAMDGVTTIAWQIERLIARLDGAAVCDDCVTERLGLSARSQADTVTRGLGGQPGYERQKAPCVLCGATKTVIRRRPS